MKKLSCIPTLVGHNTIVVDSESKQTIIRVTKSQSLHRTIINDAINIAVNDLGSSKDLVGLLFSQFKAHFSTLISEIMLLFSV